MWCLKECGIISLFWLIFPHSAYIITLYIQLNNNSKYIVLINKNKNINIRILPLFAGLLILSGCNHEQPRASNDDILQATELKGVELERQRISDLIFTVEDVKEPDPFELQQYPTYSIWPRVREGFKLKQNIDHRWVQAELKWYSSHPEYLHRTMKRAEPFIYYILEEAEKRDLPSELGLLPIVESAYQPFA